MKSILLSCLLVLAVYADDTWEAYKVVNFSQKFIVVIGCYLMFTESQLSGVANRYETNLLTLTRDLYINRMRNQIKNSVVDYVYIYFYNISTVRTSDSSGFSLANSPQVRLVRNGCNIET